MDLSPGKVMAARIAEAGEMSCCIYFSGAGSALKESYQPQDPAGSVDSDYTGHKGPTVMKLLKRTRQAAWVALLAALVGAGIVSAQNSGDALERGFQNPPDSAKPRVWWHWMNGNITREGIKADLEWMHRVGLGGFQNFDAALSTPQ